MSAKRKVRKLNNKQISSYVDQIAGPSRKTRQNAAAKLAAQKESNLTALEPYIMDFIDALNRPEARTRWECLDILSELCKAGKANKCQKAIDGAEAALFDEYNGTLRLSALQFLCAYGSTTPARGDSIWPLIDDAIQCYHGDMEFRNMLVAIVAFSTGNISKEVKNGLKERMAFDAEFSEGPLKRRAATIVKNCK
ncbi:MAG: hypothetical protein HUJ51_00365 [Eggerthellaceae bacterium]|nr:hypothetical protein [Eggerthellaceae bacterium]